MRKLKKTLDLLITAFLAMVTWPMLRFMFIRLTKGREAADRYLMLRKYDAINYGYEVK